MIKAPLIKHIEELRKRLIYSVIAVILASAASYIYKEEILLLFVRYIEKAVFLTPHEALISYLKLSLICGILVASPFLIYQLWAFVWSSFRPTEKKYTALYGAFSLILFLTGAAFGYFLGLPVAVDFLLGFASDRLLPMISIGNYITFCGILILLFALLFEEPLIIFFLADVGIIAPRQLAAKRRYIIVALFIIAAILSPPDIFTQFLIAVPLYLLFEFSILLAKFAKRAKNY